jgi:lysozyme family protein
MKWSSTVEQGYLNLFNKMAINPGHEKQISLIVSKITSGKARYQKIETQTGVPWAWIGIVHNLEGSCNFSTYLGNGQPLSRKTTLVPAGRGPFDTWENGAIDALTLVGVSKVTDWSLSRWLYQFEAYNGFGYAKFNVNSPYIWSFSNLYSRGKYVADGDFDSSAVSAQCGAAVILKTMLDQGIITIKNYNQGKKMEELDPILSLARVVAPKLADVLASPSAPIIINLLANELKTESNLPALSKAMETQSATAVISALSKIQELFAITQVPDGATPVKAIAAPAPLTSGSVLVDVNASVAHNIVSVILFIVASYFIKDAATAGSYADFAMSGLTIIGGALSQWFNRSTLIASNRATINQMT